MLAGRFLRKFSSKILKLPIDPIDTHNIPDGFHFPDKTEVSADELIKMHEQLVTIRKIETEMYRLFHTGHIGGFLHSSEGEEPIAVATDHALDWNDSIAQSYRVHGQAFMRGISVYNIMSEVLGKKDGSSKAKGGSMHLYNRKNNFYGGNGVICDQVAVGTGLAFAYKYKKQSNVSMCLFGDGASHQGQIYECGNMAALWKLPVLFVCENNHFAMGMSVERHSAFGDQFHKMILGVPGIKAEGFKVWELRQIFKSAKEFALKHGPLVINISTYRFRNHSPSDTGKYRSIEELEYHMKKHDCIRLVADLMKDYGIMTEEQIREKEQNIKDFVKSETERALNSSNPDLKTLTEDVYSTGTKLFVRAPLIEDSIRI